ncbi:hypothetical protein B0T26DRAFT_673500 [Lasiosphaeria miniovina]|uniref:DHHA2 domain-containing protein n=1 Tax=Lasiosphaeria miniovina TaxID=1954250 RepID=A0AA40ATM7_9PEZI|nr:uncharacterized protein B0T26DRAFT_673500 [Lasiosphaeria miniovina]KAK0721709.1 hypothetical protein B0T26DRAFT_673500 [Lasiosphaeria miniovina]
MSPPSRLSLKAFLATAKKAFAAPAAQRPNPLTFVVGNESAALLLAYFRTYTPPHTLHIPLSNLHRADLALRAELSAVLRPAGLKPEDLLTLSDLPSPETSDGAASLRPEDTRWFLVDHNALTGDLAKRFGASPVIGCIDHHDDEGAVPRDATPRVIEKSGSCMSLVVDQYRDAWDAHLAADAAADAELAHVALGPILIDTTNLTAKAKTTDWDVRAVEFVESKLAAAAAAAALPQTAAAGPEEPYDRNRFYDDVSRLKEDISSLSYHDILRKDYKQWTDGDNNNNTTNNNNNTPRLTLGISSTVKGFAYLVSDAGGSNGSGGRDEFLAALRQWAGEQQLDLASVMTSWHPTGGAFTREILLWALTEPAARVAQAFADKNRDALGLETWGCGALDADADADAGEWRACWTQRRIEHSRKQVAPMLREAMKGASKL